MKNTSSEVRNCCLFLGQTLLNLLSNEDQPKLEFEIQRDEHVLLMETYMKPPPVGDDMDVNPVLSHPQNKTRPLIEVIGEEEERNEQESEETETIDDEVEPQKKPIYLTDCFQGLLEVEKQEWVLSCLEAAPDLIRNNVLTARDLASDMTRVLLYLNNECDIESFASWRTDALIAITVVAPSVASKYLISQFYSRNITMVTRIDILDVLSKASQEIAGRIPRKQPEQRSLEESLTLMKITVPEEAQRIQKSWQDVVQARIDSKTRRIASKTVEVTAAPNNFGKYAGDFFFPMIESFDGRDIVFQVQEFDCLIISRLIFCLGVMMDSARNTLISRRMAKSLLHFILLFKNHHEAIVRQGVAFALCSIITSVSKVVLLEELREEMIVMKNWLIHSTEEEADKDCRKTAIQAIFLLNQLFES